VRVAEAFYPVFRSLDGTDLNKPSKAMEFCLALADSFKPGDADFAAAAIQQFEVK